MPVVIDADHLALQNLLQLLQIDHKSRYSIDLAGHRHLQRVVVPMAVAIRTLSKDTLVLVGGPRIIPIKMCGRKFGFTCKQDHYQSFY